MRAPPRLSSADRASESAVRCRCSRTGLSHHRGVAQCSMCPDGDSSRRNAEADGDSRSLIHKMTYSSMTSYYLMCAVRHARLPSVGCTGQRVETTRIHAGHRHVAELSTDVHRLVDRGKGIRVCLLIRFGDGLYYSRCSNTPLVHMRSWIRSLLEFHEKPEAPRTTPSKSWYRGGSSRVHVMRAVHVKHAAAVHVKRTPAANGVGARCTVWPSRREQRTEC